MGLKETGKKRALVAILVLIWLCEYALNIWYVKTYFIANCLDSDYAGDAVLAKHLADTGKLIFSKDWFPTTELYVIHHQLIMTPLFKLIGDYQTVWVWTSVIAFALMSAALFYFMRILGCSYIKSILAVIISLNPIMTFPLSFSVWFHGYLFYYLLELIILAGIFKCYEKEPGIGDYISVAVISFLAGLCGLRMFMLVYIPVCVLCIVNSYNKTIKEAWNVFLKAIVLGTVSAMVGFVIYSQYLTKRFGRGKLVEIGATLYNAEEIKNNILCIPQVIIQGLFIDFENTSNYLFAALVCVTVCLWLIVFVKIFQSAFGKKEENGTIKLVSLYALICVFVNLALMVMTISNEEIVMRSRYLSLSSLILIPAFVMGIQISTPLKVKDCIMMTILAMTFVSMLIWRQNMVHEYGDSTVTWRKPYIDYLVENGYTFGAATYWNADTTIFYSNGQLQIAPVNNDEEYSFFRWNTQRSFENKTPEFVILTMDEYNERTGKWEIGDLLYKDDNVVITEYIK